MRLFIAINLPEKIKDNIVEAVQKLKENYFEERFILRENWHLTICFLGYQAEGTFTGILKSIKETAAEFPAPEIELEKIILAPPERKVKTMVWIKGSQRTSEILGRLQKILEKKLVENKIHFKIDSYEFNAHLTLVRFQNHFVNPSPLEFSDFQPLVFKAETLDLMESHLKRSGAEYEILSRFAFKPSIL